MSARPMSAIVEGMTVTADKIRALLQEGYLRADIARFLGVRYQHVRGVTVGAGIEGGLQRGIVIVPKSKPATKVAEDVAVHVLVDAGFTLLGTWIASDAGIGLSTPAPRDPGVYAFALGGVVKYIG